MKTKRAYFDVTYTAGEKLGEGYFEPSFTISLQGIAGKLLVAVGASCGIASHYYQVNDTLGMVVEAVNRFRRIVKHSHQQPWRDDAAAFIVAHYAEQCSAMGYVLPYAEVEEVVSKLRLALRRTEEIEQRAHAAAAAQVLAQPSPESASPEPVQPDEEVEL